MLFQRSVIIQLSPKAAELHLCGFFHIPYYFDLSIVYKVSLPCFGNALSFCSDHSPFFKISAALRIVNETENVFWPDSDCTSQIHTLINLVTSSEITSQLYWNRPRIQRPEV